MSIDLIQMGAQAKNASRPMSQATTLQKNNVLLSIAEALKKQANAVLKANVKDRELAKAASLNESMLDRLSLENRLEGLIQDIKSIVTLPDPIRECFDYKILSNGLKLHKERTPLGVLGVIYESRPNVTIDISCLAIKTGNCVILRGGSETLHTNSALIKIIQHSLKEYSLPAEAVQFIESPDRILVKELLQLYQFIDLIIPRGGAQLHAFCRENSRIPVITGGIGICHLFVDETADLKKSLEVIKNAKTQRPTVCNALDTVLIHENIAADFLPELIHFLNPHKVIFKLDKKAWQLAHDLQHLPLQQAKDDLDWDTEWLSLILGIKIVKDLEEAIGHIQKHSTGHSDGILTQNQSHAQRFIEAIDSAAVYVNASTRFTDGGQFGLGAEVAISTQKIHARGPMGLPELTSYKWVVIGDYQTRT